MRLWMRTSMDFRYRVWLHIRNQLLLLRHIDPTKLHRPQTNTAPCLARLGSRTRIVSIWLLLILRMLYLNWCQPHHLCLVWHRCRYHPSLPSYNYLRVRENFGLPWVLGQIAKSADLVLRHIGCTWTRVYLIYVGCWLDAFSFTYRHFNESCCSTHLAVDNS